MNVVIIQFREEIKKISLKNLDLNNQKNKNILFFAEEKDRLARRAQQDAIKNAKKQAIDTLQELQTLEQQRENIMGKLQQAQNNVVRFAQPQADPNDLAQLAKIPETPEEELDTLVNVADAVINSNIKIGIRRNVCLFKEIED